MPGQAEAKVERWRQRLLDLSRRNRLLYFKPTRQTVQINAPACADLFLHLVVKERALKFPVHVRDEDLTLSDETGGNNATTLQLNPPKAEASVQAPLRPGYLATSLAAPTLARILYKTRLQARSALEERGVNTLFVTTGMLEWRESDSASETVKSPLILIPVQIEQLDKDRTFPLAPFDDDITINPTLAFLLKRDFGIELPPLPEEPVPDTFTRWIADVRQLVRPHGWKILEESWLGQFSFLKMAMVRDLDAYRDQIVLHPVAGALAGAHDLPMAANVAPSAEELDRSPKPAELFPVLDADSSQMDALSHSVAGHNLIIDGPPGTGKSQTIANIIAALLANGKKVLFVSEKMAALEVVKKRLDDAGLGAFCLEAHSHRANKREVIAQLARSLKSQNAFQKPDQEIPQRFAELRQRRDQLNGYVAALHEPRDQYGRTTFAMHGKLAKLTALPDLPFDVQLPVNLLHLTVDQWEAMNGAVRRMASMTGLLRDYHEHPWRGSTITTFSLGLQDQLRMQFRSFAQLVDETAAASGDVARLCGLPAPHTLETIERMITVARLAAQSPYPPAGWFTEESLLPLVQSATAYRERFDKWHAERQELMHLYTPALIELNCARLAQRLGPAHTAALTLIDRGQAAVPRAVELRAVIHEGLAKAQEALSTLPSELAALAAIVGQPEPDTVAGAERLIQAGLLAGSDPRPAASWLSWDSLLSAESEARGARERQGSG